MNHLSNNSLQCASSPFYILNHLLIQMTAQAYPPMDESHVTDSQRQMYENNNGGSIDAGSMGSLATMQVCHSLLLESMNLTLHACMHTGPEDSHIGWQWQW